MSKFFKFSLFWRSWVKASNKTRKFSFYVMIKLVFISMIYFWEIDNGWLLPSFLLDAFKFTGMDKPALFWKVCFLDKQNKQTKVKMDPYQWVAILFNGHDTLKQIKKGHYIHFILWTMLSSTSSPLGLLSVGTASLVEWLSLGKFPFHGC